MKMRVRWTSIGNRIAAQVFTRKSEQEPFVKAGDLEFDEVEWRERHRLFRNVDFIAEGMKEHAAGKDE